MEFAILGPLEVRDQHRRIEVPSAIERRLLAMLIVHANEVVSTDRLIDALWDGKPPPTAANTLQTHVSHLRRALDPDRLPRAQGSVLRTHARGYELVVGAEALDATRFERLVLDGHHALASDPAQAAESLRAALELWRGEPLAEFSCELFAQAEIARLTEMHAVAMEDRVEADLALGRHGALCSELSRAVAQKPLRERRWSQLIRALYCCGRQAEAMAAYARLREKLAEQLGIEPSPELVRLHEAMLAQSPELDWRPPPPSARPSVSGEPPTAESLLPEARTALAAHDWAGAFDLLSRADQAVALSGEELEGLAESAWWVGRYRESLYARQRVHHAYLLESDHHRAALNAAILTMQYAVFRQFAVANGWLRRAQRLLDAEPDCVERGYLSLATAFVALGMGDPQTCLVAARASYDLGIRHSVAELLALGMVFEGTVLIHRGQVAEGRARHDEGMAMAVGGDLSRLATEQIFCQVVTTCCELGDYRRAEEWTEAIEDCFVRSGLASFPGNCETHRIAIMISRGSWALAEREAHRICAADERTDLAHAGQAFTSIGDIHLRIGDLAGAEDAYTKAEELTASPLPGRARLELVRGRPAEAAVLINAALEGEGWDRLGRVRLLPDQVAIAVAVDDFDTARAAAAELAESARIFDSKVMCAAAEAAWGALVLATGEEDPLPPLRRSVRLWQEAGSPYESARARVLLATALAQADHLDSALVELADARASFHQLGARLDAEAVVELLSSIQKSRSVLAHVRTAV